MDHILMVGWELLHLSVQVFIVLLSVVVRHDNALGISLYIIEEVNLRDIVVLLRLQVVIDVTVAATVETLHDIVLGFLVVKTLHLLLEKCLITGFL